MIVDHSLRRPLGRGQRSTLGGLTARLASQTVSKEALAILVRDVLVLQGVDVTAATNIVLRIHASVLVRAALRDRRSSGRAFRALLCLPDARRCRARGVALSYPSLGSSASPKGERIHMGISYTPFLS